MQNNVCGHIDCPTCGTPKGMRITHDKNGDPFGFCELKCGQQLRVGGNPARVKSFIDRYPFAGKKPVTVTEEKPPQVPTGTGTATTPPAKPQGETGKPVPVQAKPVPAVLPPKTPEKKPAKQGWFTPLLGVQND